MWQFIEEVSGFNTEVAYLYHNARVILTNN